MNDKNNKRNAASPASMTRVSHTAAAVALAALIGLGACAPRVDTRGNALHPEALAEIKPGEDTRNAVLDKLGSPSSQSTFGGETWYYISEVTETTAFLAPEIKDRQVVVVKFDEAGVVSTVETLDETQAETVELAPGETPTAGNSLTFFEQLIHNVGRFNAKDAKNN